MKIPPDATKSNTSTALERKTLDVTGTPEDVGATRAQVRLESGDDGAADPAIVLERVQLAAGLPVQKKNANNQPTAKMDLRLSDLLPTPSHVEPQVKFRNFGTSTAPIWIPSSAVGSLGGVVQQFMVKGQRGTYLKCVTWDGANMGIDFVYVALPPKLRSTINNAMIEGNLITYTYPNWPERVATITGVSETEVIVPRYLGDDIIYAVKPNGGTNGVMTAAPDPVDGIVGHPTSPPVPVVWQDLNVDGRAWAKKYGT